ncbi:MAG: phosphodiesterase [Alphaproteobacteria bacterium]|nr:MAG: phosphodiesterase [Alphaproteobacteria bacterium]
MLIAQVTDIHLGFQPDDPAELNRKRFDDVLASLLALDPRPDLLLASGDLTEAGTLSSYRTLKSLCDDLPFPVLPALGNHDDRTNFCSVFSDVPLMAGGHVQYCHDAGPLRIVVLDTLEAGRHGGSFDDTRAAWLDAALAASPKPTIVVLHHPPIETGNGWMTESADAPWVELLRATLAPHRHVIRLLSGHLHRAIVTGWGGTTLAVCPSTAPQVALDFRALDADRPDGRDMIVAEGPGFALHYWTGRDLVTHFGTGGDHPVLARYNARMQPTVRHILAER